MRFRNYRNICIKVLTGSATEIEKKDFNLLLGESEDNKKEFDRLAKLWQYTSPADLPEFPNTEYEWNELQNRIKIQENELTKNLRTKKFIKFYGVSLLPRLRPLVIGFLTVFVVISFFIWMYKENSTYNPKLQTIATANGEHKKINLPDGSTAVLNSGSTIQYNESFGDESRRIKLSGEAFFSVKKGEHPFVVVTGNACVKVLGTKFNVWARNNGTRIIVKEGEVNFTPKKMKNNSVLLTKNQMSFIGNNSAPAIPQAVNFDISIGWLEGKLVFAKTPLNEVTEELERYFNTKIALADDVKQISLTGSFNNNSVDNTLKMVCLALDLELEKSTYKYIIKQKKNLDN